MITWPEPHDKESKGHKEKSVHFKFLNKPKKQGSLSQVCSSASDRKKTMTHFLIFIER